MFVFGFNGRVKAILRREFSYRTGSYQNEIFKDVASQAKAAGLNEYDAAIMFMMVVINAIAPGGEDVLEFAERHLNKIEELIPRALGPSKDIYELFDSIKLKHGLTIPGFYIQAGRAFVYPTFDDWLKEFKDFCGALNIQLRVDDDGGSLIDWMDQWPLRRAFNDQVLPEVVAKGFASEFDFATFLKNQ